ncbi:MAG: hypothetical protein LUQ09_06010, partial [Methanomassiliicoccales archaeon]|nr:hypothetical protein [Methanomassiliicoccales archaeon]
TPVFGGGAIREVYPPAPGMVREGRGGNAELLRCVGDRARLPRAFTIRMVKSNSISVLPLANEGVFLLGDNVPEVSSRLWDLRYFNNGDRC